MRKGLIGAAVGLVAAAGGAVWAVKRLFSPPEYSVPSSDGASSTAAEATTAPPRREGLDPMLLEILACPEDKQPVIYQKEGDAERLTCTHCGKRYPVREGIPVMLIDEAQPGPIPSQEEIAAAKKLAPEGKPAIVGAATTPGAAGDTTATAAGPTAPPASSAEMKADTSAGAPATIGAASSAQAATSEERIKEDRSLDPGSGVGG